MAVIKKVQSKVILPKEVKKEEAPKKGSSVVVEERAVEGGRREEKNSTPKKKYCQFCASSSIPRYWDAASLRRFISDRGRIVARTRSGACAKHQRRVTKEIKRARHLALLPFTSTV